MSNSDPTQPDSPLTEPPVATPLPRERPAHSPSVSKCRVRDEIRWRVRWHETGRIKRKFFTGREPGHLARRRAAAMKPKQLPTLGGARHSVRAVVAGHDASTSQQSLAADGHPCHFSVGQRFFRKRSSPPVPAGQRAARPVILLLLLLAFQFRASAQSPADAPRIHFAATTNDFGRVIAGSVLQHEFIFTNTGSAPLRITEVKATCGCTTAGAWTREVLPGQTGVIPLQYQTPIVDFPTVKEATVTCNDPSSPVVRLELRATIWRPIALEPAMSVFIATNPAYAITDPQLIALGTNGVRIINQEPQPLTLTLPVGDNRLFAAELRTNVPGWEYEVRLRLVPPLLSARRYSGYFSLQTSSTNQPVLRVMAYLQLPSLPVGQTATPPVPAAEVAPLDCHWRHQIAQDRQFTAHHQAHRRAERPRHGRAHGRA